MVDLLIRWSLRNRALVVLLSLGVFLGGSWLALRMPVDVFPDLTAPTVTVIVEGRSLSPQEMEAQVAIPVEAAMNGASDVRRVRSATALGITVVWVEFEWGVDIARARQTVAERLSTLAGRFPEEVDAPKIASVSSVMGEVLFLSLTSDTHDGMELRTAAEARLRRRLMSVAGVSQVTPIGGDVRQYQVVLSPRLLQERGVDAREVAAALEASNISLAGGVLVDGTRELVVEGVGRARTVDELGSTVVALRGAVPVRVADLGVVGVGPAPRRGTASSGSRDDAGTATIDDGVILAVQKQPGANTLDLTKRLDAALDELQRELPPGMRINRNLFRQSQFIETAVANTLEALVEGAAMVVLVVLLFLASLRASVVTLVVLPLSLLAAVAALQLLGGGINTMTLGGMAIAIGALVDDAIIDVENVVRRLRENATLPADRRRATLAVVYDASVEVRASVVLATAIILLVFTPLYLLDGVEGRLLQPLGTAFSVSLAASLLVALTLTPVLCTMALPGSKTVVRGEEPRLVVWLKRRYAPVLDASLRRPVALAAGGLVLLGAAVWGLWRCGTGFLPEFNEGALTIEIMTEPGTSLDESTKLARLVDEALMKHPEVAAFGRRTGRAEEDEHVQGVEASEVDLTLDMQAPARLGLPVRTRAELLDALRSSLAAIPGVQTSIGQPISHRIDHMLSGTRSGIAVKIFGHDLSALRAAGGAVRDAMAGVPGVVDLSVEQQTMVPSLRVVFDRTRLARHGMRVADAAEALKLATIGLPAGSIIEGADSWEVVVRSTQDARVSAEALAAAAVRAADGSLVALAEVADLVEDRTPNRIAREGLQRKLVVSCNTAGRDVGSVVADIRAAVEAGVQLPAGMRIEYGGQFESAESTRARLYALGILIALAIGALLHWMFRSARDAAIVMANLPLALIGGVAGVHLAGGTLTVASMIGFITVFGVAARNGIMVVSHIRHLQAVEGVRDFAEAVRRAALERLAPVLMTAFAAGLALVPLALRGHEPGNEILSPMAVVILCGLLSSTLLNMLLVPALYLRFGRPVEAAEESVHA